jgi:hypothetical protein
VGYERGVAVSKAWDEATTYGAIEVAKRVVKDLDGLCHLKNGETNRAQKVEAFCTHFVGAAFRRPLTREQTNEYVMAQFSAAPKLEDAVKRVVLLTLKSPRFLYLGLDEETPDDFEIATRLSFTLWDSLPDIDLNKAAAGRALHTREQVSKEAQRMLKDPRAHAKLDYFFQQWLQLNRTEDLSKDPKLYPDFNSDVIADLRTSLRLFLDDAVWSRESDYRQLLLANYLYLNDRLAKFYGIGMDVARSPAFVKVPLGSNDRSGVLTHPYLLTQFSYPKTGSPIHRGVFLTRNVLGRSLKPPPMAVVFRDADFSPDLTMRQKITQLTQPQACQSCHSIINPLGFTLERYDAVGRLRTTDNGHEINAASEYVADNGQVIPLNGPRDLAQYAAGSEQAQEAFIEQLFDQLVKQPWRAYGSETMKRLRNSFVASDFNIQKLATEIALTSALHNVDPSKFPDKKHERH